MVVVRDLWWWLLEESTFLSFKKNVETYFNEHEKVIRPECFLVPNMVVRVRGRGLRGEEKGIGSKGQIKCRLARE
jgi:hypothetical protein